MDSQVSCSAWHLSCLFGCLFVCLWAGYLKKLWTEIWTKCGRQFSLCDKEELIRFWWRFEFESRWGYENLKIFSDSSPLRDGAKNDIYLWYFKKLWMDYDKTRHMTWLDDKDKPIRFWFRFESRFGPSVGYKTNSSAWGRYVLHRVPFSF